MRVSDTMLSQTYLRNVYRSKNEIEKLSENITTGSKINRPSDSPAGAAKLMRLSNTVSSSESYIRNIQEGLASLTETNDSLESMLTEVTDLITMFTEAQNPTNDNFRSAYGDKVDLALDSMLDLANREYNGKYLFGGTDYVNKPFDYTADGSAIELKVTDVSGKQNVKIASNINQQINITGDELFGAIGTDDIFNTLIRIRDDFKSGSLPSQADLDLVDDFKSNLLDKITKAGNLTNKLTDGEELLNNRILVLKDLMSKEGEVDVVEAMVEMQQQDYLLQLAYKTSAMILPKSLVDYL